MPPQSLAPREQLAALLTDLIHDSHNEALRLKAAQLGLEIAMKDSDTSSSVLSQSLTDTLPEPTTPHMALQLRHLNATAKATRKAIALSAGRSTSFCRKTLQKGLANPDSVLKEIEARIQTGHFHLAKSIVQVGLTRHPRHTGLHAIREELDNRMQNEALPAPIPFPALS